MEDAREEREDQSIAVDLSFERCILGGCFLVKPFFDRQSHKSKEHRIFLAYNHFNLTINRDNLINNIKSVDNQIYRHPRREAIDEKLREDHGFVNAPKVISDLLATFIEDPQ